MPAAIERPPVEIRLPEYEQLRQPVRRNIKLPESDIQLYTDSQIQGAKIQKDLQDGISSLDGDSLRQAETNPAGFVRDLNDNLEEGFVVYDPNTQVLRYKTTPEDTGTIVQFARPGGKSIIGATPAVLAAAEKRTAPPPAANKSDIYRLHPTFQAKQKPLTPAQQAQAAAAAREAQETANRIQQAAQQRQQTADQLNKGRTEQADRGRTAQPNEQASVRSKPAEPRINPEAADLIAANKSMQQAVSYARSTQDNQKTKTARTQEAETAVLRSAQQNVGTVKASENAQGDAQQQGRRDQGIANFAAQQEKEATTVVTPGKPGKFKGRQK